jgi:predicted neutral ceramidase superfamily lipid hydrolase
LCGPAAPAPEDCLVEGAPILPDSPDDYLVVEDPEIHKVVSAVRRGSETATARGHQVSGIPENDVDSVLYAFGALTAMFMSSRDEAYLMALY